MRSNKKYDIRKLTVIAMFSALAYISTFIFHFPVMFLTFDPKDAIITIGAMFFGPVSGILMSAIVALAELATISDTGPYGLIMNFISSATFSFVAPLIYKHRRKLSGAIIGLLCSVITVTSVMMVANLLITPYYMGATIAEVLNLIPTLLLPFNLAKALLNAGLVLILYKPTTTALRAVKLIDKKPAAASGKSNIKNTFIIAIISIIVIAISISVFYLISSK